MLYTGSEEIINYNKILRIQLHYDKQYPELPEENIIQKKI